MPSNTTNYNLVKPAENEYYDVTVLNGNMDLIDAALTPTADPSQVPTGVSGKLIQWVGWIANRIKAITGKTNWYDAPATTLEDAKTHIDSYTAHVVKCNAIGDGGSGLAYTVTVSDWASQTGCRHGMEMEIQFPLDCSNHPTLNVNGWGAKDIVLEPLTAYTPCSAGDIKADYIYQAMYHTSVAAWVIKGVRLNAFESHEAEKTSDTALGHVQVDGTTITADGNGVISASATTQDKGFNADFEYYYNTTVVPIMDGSETWTSGAGTQSADTTNVKIGNQSLKVLENDNTGGALYSYRNITLDLTKFQDSSASTNTDYIYAVLFISDVTKLSNVSNCVQLLFSQAISGDSTNAIYYGLPYANLVTGWNYIRISKSTFQVNGTGAWSGIQSVRVYWISTTNAQNAYISFQYIGMIRKDPSAAAPNPFQRLVNGVWTREFTINAGEWFVGLEFENITCKSLSESSNINALQGTSPYDTFIANATFTILLAGYCNGLVWYKDANNHIRVSSDSPGSLQLIKREAGVTATVTTPISLSARDILSITLIKKGSSLSVIAVKNNNTKESYGLSTETTLTGEGNLSVYTIGGSNRTIINALAITTLEHAYHADVAESINAPHSTWIPTLTWGTATPTISASTFRYQRIAGRVKGALKIVSTDGNGASSLTISLPTPITNRSNITACCGQEKVNTTWTNPMPYIDDSGTVIAFRTWSTWTDATAAELEIFFDYEI